MPIKIVFSPFIQSNNQLFYQAQLDTQSKKINLRIFNNRGIQKNRRNFSVPSFIEDIFTADKYIIGLDKDHVQVCIIDTTKHSNKAVHGVRQVDKKDKRQQNQNNFTNFYFDQNANLIFGLVNSRQLYYFSIKRFDKSIIGGSSMRSGLPTDFSQQNLLIRHIYTQIQPINKLQVRCQLKQRPIKQKQQKMRRQIQPKIPSKIQQNDFKLKLQQNYVEQVYQICLLIKKTNTLRILQIDWNSDKVQKINYIPNVIDFCFAHKWDLILLKQNQQNHKQKSLKNRNKKYVSCQFVVKSKGQFMGHNIRISEDHVIFSSSETIFIVDSTTNTICGIFQKQYRQMTIQAIPKNINNKNTLLIVERFDKYNMRLLFQKFNQNQTQFQYTPLLVSLYKKSDEYEQQIYLQKNMEKIFTVNGFIHSNYVELVENWIRKNGSKYEINGNESQLNMDQSSVAHSRINLNTQNMSSHQLASKFLQQFIFSSTFHTNRLVNHLLNYYGVEVMFRNISTLKAPKIQQEQLSKTNPNKLKLSNHPKNMQPQIKNNSINSQQNFKSTQSKLISKTKVPNIQQIIELQIKGCNFDRWNQYLQEMIYQCIKTLKIGFGLQKLYNNENSVINQSNNMASSVSLDSPSKPSQQKYPDNNFFYQIKPFKQKLSIIINVYNRILKQVNDNNIQCQQFSYQSLSEQKLKDMSLFKQNIKKYKSTIEQNINKCKSLFLIVDLLNFTKQQNYDEKIFRQFQECVERVFKGFSSQRIDNINTFKKISYLNEQNIPKLYTTQSEIPILMMHEHFSKANIMANSDQQKQCKFQYILNGLILNIDNFQETAYFYYMISQEIYKVKMEQNKSIKQKRRMKSIIGQSSIKQQQQNPEVFALYPYMSKDLVEFFELIIQVSPDPTNKMNTILETKTKILEACDALLKTKPIPHSFIKYMIQLCAYYNLTAPVVKLIDSFNVQPYLIENQLNISEKQKKNKNNKEISLSFIQAQRFFIRIILMLVGNRNNDDLLQNKQMSQPNRNNINQKSQLLLYYLKRILEIQSLISNACNKSQKPSNKMHSSKKSHHISGQAPPQTAQNYMTSTQHHQGGMSPGINKKNSETTHINIKENNQQPLDKNIKHLLLGQFVNMILETNQISGIRFVHEIKEEFLTQEEDKNLIQELLKNHNLV